MNSVRSYLIFTLLFVAIGQASASVPLGGNRKGVGGNYDMYGCMQSNDYYVANFSAYQISPDQAKDSRSLPEAECIDLPKTGKTQIAIDLLDLDVRKKPVALKILLEDGKTIAELPMAIVKQGVLSITVDFKTAGKYQAVLTVDDKDLHTPLAVSALNIPITVAMVAEQSGGQNGLLILISVIGLLVVAAAYFVPRLLKPQNVKSAH
ncbi:MAG: hypothetical protein M0R33_16700 [Methylomonas sp.]|jgi:hypothetical protein|uniref:hypothetical protein n=1 Tax=Methylomonas sp. TaxID=418 RepID=UPI0025EB9867|nr:hypothetical protein [Methylomonas sp.]MCK9608084.1 hypothetical protein [Methylomonas sp.]